MEYSLTQVLQGAGGFFGAMGVIVYALKKNGVLTIGKPKERRNCVRVCSQHSGLVGAIDHNTEITKQTVVKIDHAVEEIGQVNKNLSEIKGFIKGSGKGGL